MVIDNGHIKRGPTQWPHRRDGRPGMGQYTIVALLVCIDLDTTSYDTRA